MVKKAVLRKSVEILTTENKKLRAGLKRTKELLEDADQKFKDCVRLLKSNEIVNGSLTRKLEEEGKTIKELTQNNNDIRANWQKVLKENSDLKEAIIKQAKRL